MSLLVCNFFANNNTVIMHQSPYSPDLDLPPVTFILFPKLKRPMKGQKFVVTEEIKTALLEDFKTIPKIDLRIGKCAGTSVLYLRWITLKGII
jgi:hypothetical protein